MYHWIPLTCLLLGVAVYINSLDLQFCFDDKYAVIENQDVTNLSSWLDLAWDDFWGVPLKHKYSHKSYRPLCVATFRLNYLVHELQPMGYHLVNVLLHGAVCYLYVQLCGVIFSEVWPTLIAGLLFAVHPIHTEAVSGVVGRAELLGAVFYLLTFLSYRKATVLSLSDKGHTMKWLAIAMVSCVASVVSKEQGITVVAVCCTYDVFLVSKVDLLSMILPPRVSSKPTNRRLPMPTIARCVVMVLCAMLILAMRLWIAGNAPKFYRANLGAHNLDDSFQRGLNYLYLVFVNSWLLISPSFLCADWSGSTLPLITSLSDPRNILTLTLFTVVAALAVTALLSQRHCHNKTFYGNLIMALAMTVFPFIPASNLFFPVGFVVAERVLYLPSMGFCLLVAIGAWHLAKWNIQWKRVVNLVVVYLLCVYTLKTAMRNRDWYSNETLSTSALKIVQTNGKMFTMLGKVHRDREDYIMAEQLYRVAITVEPNDDLLKRKLASILEVQRKYREAEMVYSDMLQVMTRNGSRTLPRNRIGQNDINLYAEYGLVLQKVGDKLERSYSMFERARKFQPQSLPIMNSIIDVLQNMGRFSEAVQFLDKALKMTHDIFPLLYTRASLLTVMGQKKAALASWRKALSMNENIAVMHSMVYLLHKSEDRAELLESVALNKRILSLQPNNFVALQRLADSYLALGEKESAVEAYRAVLTVLPKSDTNILQLGKLLYSQERYLEALSVLSRLNDPYTIEGFQLLRDCYTVLGKLEDARKAERLLAANERDNPTRAKEMLNKGVEFLNSGNASMAGKYYSRALDLDPNNTQAMIQYGMFIVNNNRNTSYVKARKLFEAALQNSTDSTAHLGLGQVLLFLNNTEEAIAHFQSYLQKEPNSALALHTVSMVLGRNGRCDAALPHFSRLGQLQKLEFEEALILSKCLIQLGEDDEADRTLQQLLVEYKEMAYRMDVTELLAKTKHKHKQY